MDVASGAGDGAKPDNIGRESRDCGEKHRGGAFPSNHESRGESCGVKHRAGSLGLEIAAIAVRQCVLGRRLGLRVRQLERVGSAHDGEDRGHQSGGAGRSDQTTEEAARDPHVEAVGTDQELADRSL
jgi:hypothetical protein